MVIGIIGAGLPGLVAGRMLAQGGHEVLLFEKEQEGGGRLATFEGGTEGNILFDYCNFCISANDPIFKQFVDELVHNKLLKPWAQRFPFFDGEETQSRYPGKEDVDYYAAPGGMNQIISYLARSVDIEYNKQVNGFTYIGKDRHKKKAWMINTTSFTPYEVDAIIVSTPAVQAYGLINMAQDETDILGLVRDLDNIVYDNSFSLMATFKNHGPLEWQAIQFDSMNIDWMVNESSYRNTADTLALVVQSSPEFYHNYHHATDDEITQELLDSAAQYGGDWLTRCEWTKLYRWKYRKARNNFNAPFVETKNENDDGLFALIGDYMQGNTIESAYLSAYKLAKHWLEVYPAK